MARVDKKVGMTNSVLTEQINGLRRLYPMNTVVHVGDRNRFLQDVHALAAATRYIFVAPPEVEGLTDEAPQLNLERYNALPAERLRDATFYVASNPAQSGIINPEILTQFWQNLDAVSTHQIATVTLDSLLSQESSEQSVPNWLVLDTFDVCNILTGAAEVLKTIDAIVVTGFQKASENAELETSELQAIEAHLEARGYVRFAGAGLRHPAFGWALYVMDWKTKLSHGLDAELASLTQQLEDLSDVSEHRINQLSEKLEETEGQLTEERGHLKRAKRSLSSLRAKYKELSVRSEEDSKLFAAIKSELMAAQRVLEVEQSDKWDAKGE